MGIKKKKETAGAFARPFPVCGIAIYTAGMNSQTLNF
jgi:hypothetical protein